MIPWDSPQRRHGDVIADLAIIASYVRSRGLPRPGSSGNRRITIRNPGKPHRPKSVQVGKRSRAIEHRLGTPWYVEWETSGLASRAERRRREEFASRDEVIEWLRQNGF